ncbi:MAG: hypothetical protein ACI9VT_001412 [Psychroserpens sp.]|jgi:hypothetical protein
MNSDFVVVNDQEVDFLSVAFPEADFSLHKAAVAENIFMSVFSCCVESEKILERLWIRINNLIGTEYQTKLDDEYSSWNIYLVFFTSQKISNALKYTIENDTFFVRKIVFDNKLLELKEGHIAGYINDYILGKDILVNSISMQEVLSEPTYSPITQSLLRANIPLGLTKKDKESRKAWLDKAILEVDSYEV